MPQNKLLATWNTWIDFHHWPEYNLHDNEILAVFRGVRLAKLRPTLSCVIDDRWGWTNQAHGDKCRELIADSGVSSVIRSNLQKSKMQIEFREEIEFQSLQLIWIKL